jgi:hypothetical protein
VIFLYLFCYDFRKINGRIKIFEKCTSGAVSHDGRLMPPYPTALSPCRRGAQQQEPGSGGKAARRQDPAAELHGGRSLAVPHGGRVFFIFLVFHFLNTFNFLKMTN